MHTYLPDEWFTPLRIDWTAPLNWLDLLICRVEDEDATLFTECLNEAEGTDQATVVTCFNQYLPDWADYANQYAASQQPML
jgi:hypothetical protein